MTKIRNSKKRKVKRQNEKMDSRLRGNNRWSCYTQIKITRCGFTIVEILLVVVLIALIAGVGGGIYVGTYKNMLAKKSARDFLLAAKYARILAIERASRCKIELDTAKNRFWLVVDELNEETGRTEQVPVRDWYFKPVEFSGNVKFENVQITPIDSEEVSGTGEQRAIVFLPNGSAQSAVIQIGDGKNHYTASVCAATGRAKIYFGTAKEAKTGTVDLDEQ